MMAYVSHSSIDYRTLRERLAHAPASLLMRSCVVAVAAVVALLALSESSHAPAPASMAKGDRVAGPVLIAPVDGARVVVDTAARTTTIERGALTALAADSPMAAKER